MAASCSSGHDDDNLKDLVFQGAVVRVPKDWKQAQRKNTTVVQSPSNAAERIEVTVVPASEAGPKRSLETVVAGVKYQIRQDNQPAPSDPKAEVGRLPGRILSWSYDSSNSKLALLLKGLPRRASA